MSIFFLFIELSIYVFAGYLFLKKKELAIIYLPVLNFANVIIDPVLPKAVYTAVVSLLILSFIIKNQFFFRKNFFSLILVGYFLVLLTKTNFSGDVKWPHIFSVLWLFTLIPLIASIYPKYPRQVLNKELSTSAFILLGLFIVNSFISTVFKFSPNEMYHISSGILYGNLYAAGFNSLAVALFILLLSVVSEKKLLHFLVFLISFAFVMLCLRRSVMGLSALGVVVASIALMTQAKVKVLFSFVCIIGVIGYFVYLKTDFATEFTKRVELRQLDERSLDEEKRLFEYDLLYRDMFVDEKYSPWFGFELFNSPGNYGGGVFYDRSLHGDLPSLAHSSGILGVLLYLLMVSTAFLKGFRAAKTKQDKLMIAFGVICFMMYTGTGRLTELTSLVLIFLLVMLPISGEAPESEELKIEDADYVMVEEPAYSVH